MSFRLQLIYLEGQHIKRQHQRELLKKWVVLWRKRNFLVMPHWIIQQRPYTITFQPKDNSQSKAASAVLWCQIVWITSIYQLILSSQKDSNQWILKFPKRINGQTSHKQHGWMLIIKLKHLKFKLTGTHISVDQYQFNLNFYSYLISNQINRKHINIKVKILNY